MNCPECGGKSTVADSVAENDFVYRRRRCKVCGEVFYTEETISEDVLFTRSMITQLKNK